MWLNLLRVCEHGQSVYTPQQYLDLFQNYFRDRLKGYPQVRVSLWCEQRRIFVVCEASHPRGSTFHAHLNVAKKTLHRGERYQPSLALPFLQDDEWMEMECMCLFLQQTLEHAPVDQFRAPPPGT